MKFKFNRTLVTGGAGFIGCHIVDRLVENGAREDSLKYAVKD